MDILPLVPDPDKKYNAGWCTYADDFNNLPEVEYFCGGVNSKIPRAAALWRQGHLLHFGFEQTPAEMNDAGRNLLLNSIAYIARFTEDRPIAVTPSVFSGRTVYLLRYPEEILKRKDRDLGYLTNFIAGTQLQRLNGKSREEHSRWFEESRDFLHPGMSGKLEVDPDAKELGARLGKPAFFEKIAPALDASDSRAQQAVALLARYVPAGPGGKASAQDWQRWLRENDRYLFFSDAGGYRYYLDPLAKARGTPTLQLRGPARATR